MTKEEQREKVIQGITELLRHSTFTFEYRVKKKPTGVKIISEVTQEQLEAIRAHVKKKNTEERK